LGTPGEPARDPFAGRLVSLDAFRGFTIASMVLVNNPGDWGHIYAPLEHAKWNGWTFTDWIFPFFLFICGVAMAFSLGRRAGAGANRQALVLGTVRRAAIVFAIGLALSTVRIPGVLQRIGLCIALAAPLVVLLDWRGQVASIVALFAAYIVAMLLVPVPDVQGTVGAGILEPGRDAGAYVDRLLMGGHLWAQSKTWDPEGLVSTLPAIGTLLFGVLTGTWLKGNRPPIKKTVAMAFAGVIALLVGELLDATLMPINKSLWTVSYAVFMAGWALLVLAAFHWLIDTAPSVRVQERARAALLPFTIYGMNALFLFALSSLIAKILGAVKVGGGSLKAALYAPLEALPIGAVNSSLLFAILFNLVIFAVAWWMWRRRWFITV
jgi:predicted acyltransferase